MDEARLAEAGIADHCDDLSMPAAHQIQRLAQLAHLVVTADEAGQPAPRRRLQLGARRAAADDLIDLNGIGEALDRYQANGVDGDIAFGEAQRVGGGEHRSRLRHLLHAGGEMHRLADDGVFHVQVVADGADGNLAGIEADADRDGDAVRALDLVGVKAHRLLHAQRGVAGAHRVVLMRQRRAEQCHDAVAHDTMDGAFVAMHRLHHALEDGVEQLLSFLGIAVGEQL